MTTASPLNAELPAEQILTELAERAAAPRPELVVDPYGCLNAALEPAPRSRIIIGADLAAAPRYVLAGLLAHELGHIPHTRRGDALAAGCGFTGPALAAGLGSYLAGLATLAVPPLALTVGVLGLLLAVTGLSRHREHQADQFAAGLVGEDSLAAALRWKRKHQPDSVHVARARRFDRHTGHLLASHPTLEARLRALRTRRPRVVAL